MPKYDFECLDCGKNFEKITTSQKINEVKCLKCGSEKTKKLLSTPAIILKGKGFYKNDSKQKDSSSGCSSSSCSSCSGCS